jgi:hypothetical protein
MSDESANKVTINDWLDPILGPAEYSPPTETEDFSPMAQLENTGHGLANTFRGLRSLEALGLARIGRMTPTVHQGMFAGAQGLNAALSPIPTPFNENLAKLLGVSETLDQLKANPAAYEDILRSPIEQQDLPYIGAAAKQIIKQPLDDYIRPIFAGYPEAPLANFARDPFLAAVNLSGAGALAKGTGAGKLAQAAKLPQAKTALKGVGDRVLRGQITKSVQAFQKAVAESPLAQADAAMRDITGKLPTEMQQSFRGRRSEIKSKWEAIPDDVKDAVAPGMGLTDATAVQAISKSPAAQEFVGTVNMFEDKAISEALKRGLVDDDMFLKTRVGPQYMSAVRRRRWPAPQVPGKGTTRFLQAKDLEHPLIMEELREFAAQQKRLGEYVPLVSEQEAGAFLRQPIADSLFQKKGKSGALMKRLESGIARSAAGYLQLSSGKNTANLADAFIVRLEQIDRAIALFDWAEQFEERFAQMPVRAQKLIAARMDQVIEQAFEAAGLPKRQINLTEAISMWNQEGATGFMEGVERALQGLADYVTGKTPGFAVALDEAWQSKGLPGRPIKGSVAFQRVASILPDLFFPLYMTAQQAIAMGLHSFSGPRPMLRTLIASYLVANPRVAKMIVPSEVLEHSRVFRPQWADARWLKTNPAAKAFLNLAADAVHKLSLYQDMTTRAINYFRATAAVSRMMEEFSTLSPGAQKYLLTGLRQQFHLQKLVRNLTQTKRAMSGGFTFRRQLEPAPILEKLKGLGSKRRYRTGAIKKATKRYNAIADRLLKDAANLTPAQIANLEKLQTKLLSQIDKWQKEATSLRTERDTFMADKKPILGRRALIPDYLNAPSWKTGTFVKGYLQEKQMGMRGMSTAEATKLLDNVVEFVNNFYGNYEKRHVGFLDDLNTTFVWLNMKIHAITLGKELATRYGITGQAANELARFAGEQQERFAEERNLPPWVRNMGVWESDRWKPDGSRLLHGPHGWILLTEALSLPEHGLHMLFPSIAGLEGAESDLHWFLKASVLFSGQRPGSERSLNNPGYYRVGERFYNPYQLAGAIRTGRPLNLMEDSVETTWPNLGHQIFQSLTESASEKWWSQAKTWNKVITMIMDKQNNFAGQEPSDLTLPLNPFAQYPKHLMGPFGPVQPAGPVSMTALIPGGNKFNAFTTRQDGRSDRFEMQQRKALMRKAAEAAGYLNTDQPAARLRTSKRKGRTRRVSRRSDLSAQ